MQFFDDVRIGIEQDKRSGAFNVYLDQGPFAKRVTLGSKKDSPAAKELSSVLMQRELEALKEWQPISLGGAPNRISALLMNKGVTGFYDLEIWLDPLYTGKHDGAAATIAICSYQPWFKVVRSSLSESTQSEIAAYMRERVSQLSNYQFTPYAEPTPQGLHDAYDHQRAVQGVEGVVNVTSTPLSQVIGQFTKLNDYGDRILGLCPLHGGTETTLVVHDRSGLFVCDGCGATGGVVEFLLAMAKKANR